MTDKEAMKLALEALISCQLSNYGRDWVWPVTAHEQAMKNVIEAITALKERLAQPEQEPVATLEDLEQEIYQNTRNFVSRDVMEWMLKRYYTHPPQRTEENT
jgi:serine/threonine protein kinase HipA of HipAB toxin-antitoxin module